MGKAVRKDLDAHKATFISLLGLEQARQKAFELSKQAVSCLDIFDEKADLMRLLAQYIVERHS